MATASFVLNGTPGRRSRQTTRHLLAALREELDVTSPKDGCSPSGQCGCCTVLVDGKAVVVSCQQSLDQGRRQVDRHARRASTTDERHRFADAFAACGGLQCGFCIPGIVMRAKAQIDKKGADLDSARTWRRHLGAHLCRCTGYVKILDAIEAVAKGKTFAAGARGSRRRQPVPKYEAAELAPRRPRLHRRHARAGHAARRAAPHRPRPRRRHRDRHVGGRRAPAAWSVFTAADIPASCASASSTRTGR